MNFHNVIILIKSVFNKDKNNYYYNIFLEKASYDVELTFLKESVVIRQKSHKSAIFVTTGIFQTKTLNFNQMSAIDVTIY